MRKLTLLLLIAFCFSSCQDDTEKAANELCDCLSAKTKKSSPEFKKLMKKVAKSDIPSKAFTKGYEDLEDETKQKLKVEIDKLIETDDESVRRCTKKIRDYKIRGKDEEERSKKIIELMAEKSGCEIGSGQWAMAVEQTYKNEKKKNKDIVDEEETDKPKKKTADDEEEQ